jgi:hypothetical protein
MAKHPMKGSSKQQDKVESKHGYHVHADGKSFWGVNVMRGGKPGYEITKEQHNDKDLDKVALFTELKAAAVEPEVAS